MRPLLMTCAVLALLVSVATGAIPETVHYQGVLLDGGGVPVPDGSYLVVFRILAAPVGGPALWVESHNVFVEDGLFTVTLGSVNPIVLPFDALYWLETRLPPDPALTPRIRLAAVPYALRAKFAEASGPDDDWVIDGDDIYHVAGSVGIGALPPLETEPPEKSGNLVPAPDRGENKLYVAGLDQKVVYAHSSNSAGVDGTAALYGYRTSAAPSHGTAWTGSGSNAAVTGYNYWGDNYSGGVTGFSYGDFGNCGGVVGVGFSGGSHWGSLGYFDESATPWGLYTPENAYVGGTLMLPDGATAGHVLTSDASGNAAWESAPGGVGGGGTANYVAKFTGASTLGNSMIYDTGTAVGIGTTTPAAALTIEEAGPEEALEVLSTSPGVVPRTVNFKRTVDPGEANDILQIKVPETAPDNFQFIECERGLDVRFAVDGDGRVTANGGAEIDGGVDMTGILSVETFAPRAGEFRSGNEAPEASAVYGEITSSGAHYEAAGVRGYSKPQEGYGVGGYFEGGRRGVEGYAEGTISPVYGVYGQAHNIHNTGPGNAYGVYGEATQGAVAYGVYARADGTGANNVGIYAYAGSGASANNAGEFAGNVNVIGHLYKTSGAFRIDHPLDPTNMYLNHSFVESPDMKNIYDGMAALDGNGEAWVELPEWFEPLNRDFRYQLTAIGAPGPNLYIAEKIGGNRFAIGGGTPGMEVSWQVTGIRQDPYAEENRIPVEERKPENEIGTYLHPSVYGAPETMGADYIHHRDVQRSRPRRPPATGAHTLEKRDRTDDQE